MEEIAKGLYRVVAGHPHAPDRDRMWHDCEEQRNRREKRVKTSIWRIELDYTGKGVYRCPYCEFKYPS